MRFKALACALILASAPALADPSEWGSMPGMAAVSPREVLTIVRSSGLIPISPPVRIAGRYDVRAVDPYGTPVRVSVDARRGDIIWVRRIGVGAAFEAPPMPPELDRAPGFDRRRPRGPMPRDAYDDWAPAPPRSIPDPRLQMPSPPADAGQSRMRTGRSSDLDEGPQAPPRAANPSPSRPLPAAPARRPPPAVATGSGEKVQPPPKTQPEQTDRSRRMQNADSDVARSTASEPPHPGAANPPTGNGPSTDHGPTTDHGAAGAFPPVTPLQ